LLNVLKPNAVPEDASGPQPVRLRYTGATVQKQIAVHYEAGLETSIDATLECWERVAIRFLADDPYWYEIGDSADVLVSIDSATFRIVAGKLRAIGQWDELGPPNVAGVYGGIEAVAVGPDGLIYFGGDFTNFDNLGGAADYIISYNQQTGTWAVLAGGLNAPVSALAFGPDGTLYIGGLFTAAGGNPQADYFCTWNGVAFGNLGNPDAAGSVNEVKAITVAQNGDIYVGGDFTTFANVANADRVAYWDVSAGAWTAVAAGCNADVETLALAPNGDIYIGGVFTNYGDPDGDRIVVWDGAALSSLGTGANGTVFDVVVASDGVMYMIGNFTTAGGETVARIASWNGTAFSALGTGINNTGEALGIGPDDMVYVGGSFTTAGGIAVANRRAKWNGTSWAHIDFNNTTDTEAFAFGPVDPVVPTNYDIWLGLGGSQLSDFSGPATVTNDGTERAFPKLVISRTGGTQAILEQIRNETTGRELLFNYSLLDGETLTIDLTPTNKSIVSGFFGPRLDAVLANSDFGEFALLAGNNLITAFVDTDATVTAFIQWDDKYWSQD